MKYRVGIWVIVAVTIGIVSWVVWPRATPSPANTILRSHLNSLLSNLVPAHTQTNFLVNNTNATTQNTNAKNVNMARPTASVNFPIRNFLARVTKKPFGIHITPATSPIQPERFTGYHTGADAETSPSEQKSNVPIFSIADGTVVVAHYVSGYGGVIMIQHSLGGKTYTALYGHLRQSSFTVKVGKRVQRGQQIGVLGTEYTSETDGERRHLHVGLLVGASTNVHGYVSTTSQLSPWVDPVALLKSLGAVEP